MEQNQVLNTLLGQGQTYANNQTQQVVDQLFSKIQPQLQLLINVSVALTIILTIIFLVSAVHKWRVQSAILRIDKNLKKLVDHQLGTESELKQTPDKQDSETKDAPTPSGGPKSIPVTSIEQN